MSEKKRDMQELWQDCLFLSKEMHKFTSVNDLELFENLLKQREEVLAIIKVTDDKDGYIKSEAGQKLIKDITKLDEKLQEKVVMERNLLKKNMEVSTAYEGFIGNNVAVGKLFDSNTK